jgi:predicted enzyme related to lactoylglutathione lyase
MSRWRWRDASEVAKCSAYHDRAEEHVDMPATLRHFAINADNVQRAKAFYERVFGWTFTVWGPPDFYQVKDAGSGLVGALQKRRTLQPEVRTNAFETSFAVDDIRAALAAAEACGGKVLMQPYRIEGVGDIGYFEDSEGNICGVAQYLPGTWK